MKQNKSIILVLLLVAFITGCRQEEKVSKWPNVVNYEIFVRSFCDSNGDGIGDFRGMTSRLDHLSDLGVEGIWLMPIHPSSSYHQYNVEDYYDVHPDHGTLDDFRDFIKEAHNRNIKVVIDMVINHSGSGLPWFRDAVEKGKESPYWNYYIWAGADTIQAYVDAKAKDFPEYGKGRRWHTVPGTDYLVYSYFGRGMPQLNYDNPAVRDEMFKVGRFWLSDMGVDGFRLDAARHVYPEYRAEDIYQFWEEYRQEMLKVKENVYLLGEVWDTVEAVAPYLQGLPALFNFDLSKAIQKAVVEETEGSMITHQLKVLNVYRSINPDYIDATFITNHDQNRIMSVVEGNESKARMAAALLFTLPGSPYVYYGEEIGMTGMKPDPNIREPFIWDTDSLDKYRTSWRKPVYNTVETVVPLSLQKDDENSLYSWYKELIRLRTQSLALTYGDLGVINHETDGVVAFLRDHEKESLLVLHNLSGDKKSFNRGSNLSNYRKIRFGKNGSQKKGDSIELNPYSTLVLSE